VARQDALEAIVEVGRRTRRRPPRWQWIAALAVTAACAGGLAHALLSEDRAAPRARAVTARNADDGLGRGLAIGLCVGVGLGWAIGRQRADHSSRRSP
jgi:hypothetical protein